MLKAGDHVPGIPLLEVAGNGLVVVPEHNGLIGVKVGVTFGVITICKVVVFAHWVPLGVKV